MSCLVIVQVRSWPESVAEEDFIPTGNCGTPRMLTLAALCPLLWLFHRLLGFSVARVLPGEGLGLCFLLAGGGHIEPLSGRFLDRHCLFGLIAISGCFRCL